MVGYHGLNLKKTGFPRLNWPWKRKQLNPIPDYSENWVGQIQISDLMFLEAYLFFTNAINFWSIPYLWNIFKTEVQRSQEMTQRCQMFQVDLHPEGGALCTLGVCSCKPSPSQPHLLHVSCACDGRKVNIGMNWSEIWSPLKSRLRQCSTWTWEWRRGTTERFIHPQTLDRCSSRTARGEMGF